MPHWEEGDTRKTFDLFKKRDEQKRKVPSTEEECKKSISDEQKTSRTKHFPLEWGFQSKCKVLPCKRCLESEQSDNDITPCWLWDSSVNGFLMVRVHTMFRGDPSNLKGYSSFRENDADNWRKEAIAKNPFLASLIDSMLSILDLRVAPDNVAVATVTMKKVEGQEELGKWLSLAHLLLLASWKCDHAFVVKYTKVYYKYLGAEAQKVYEQQSDQEHREKLTILRDCLEEGAAFFLLLMITSLDKKNSLPKYRAVQMFLGFFGSQCAHVFQVGTGSFPLVEQFFVSLRKFSIEMWHRRPVPKLSTVQLTEDTKDQQQKRQKCAICKSDISSAAKIFPLEYTYSKSDACYPREIFVSRTLKSDCNEYPDMESLTDAQIAVACKPECMVRHIQGRDSPIVKHYS
jgi:hypothetical protein